MDTKILIQTYWMMKDVSEQALMSWLSGITAKERQAIIDGLRTLHNYAEANELEEDFS